jgi:hypothetical protein
MATRMRTTRLLIGVVTTLCLLLALMVGTASAQTVYNYVYSGTFINGSAAGKKFDGFLGGLAFDAKDDQLLVGNGGGTGTNDGWISKYTPAGVAVNFSSLGSPRLPVNFNFNESQITVDERPGPTEGDLFTYAGEGFFGGAKRAYKPGGAEIPGFANGTSENLCGVGVPPTGEEVITAARNGLYRVTPEGKETKEEDAGSPGYQPGVKTSWEERGRPCRLTFDSHGDMYGIKASVGPFGGEGNIAKLTESGLEYYELNQGHDSNGLTVDSRNDDVFAITGGTFEGQPSTFELYDGEGRLLGSGWGAPDPSNSYEGLQAAVGIAVDPVTGDVWVANRRAYAGGNRHVEKFIATEPHVIPDVTADTPGYDDPSGETVTLRGSLDPDGVETTDCHFEYGSTQELTESIPCSEGSSFNGSSAEEVTATIPATKGKRYFYKLSAKNGNEQVALSNEQAFLPQGKPKLLFAGADQINTDGARLRTEFDPNGGNASYVFEYGQNGNFEHSTAPSATFGFTSDPGLFSGSNKYEPGVYSESSQITGLDPGTAYEFRVKITNEGGSVTSTPQTFRTYVPDSGTDPCPNAQIRQQTEGSLLPDCRAYELVSAANTGGYDVQSDIVPGQEPLEAYPDAEGKLLYSLHFGVIPGIAGSPTNFGRDPYIASRGPDGWTTKYVGLPANGMADEGAFGSPLLGADSRLETLAFGGSGICKPCFDDNTTNVPLRRPDGSLEEGMSGTPDPAAEPAGEVRKPLSADGSHFVFGAKKAFAPGAPAEGSLGIYERDLGSDTTELVSTDQSGAALGGELAELAVSADGSRVLIGKLIGEDSSGNQSFDLYMHLAGDPHSALVAETPHGVVFNGMTSSGTKAFFTTSDPLAGDTDTSADFYRAEVGAAGSTATVTRLSGGIGGTGNTDACTPVQDWNVVSGGPNCSTVAFAGGAGIAAGDGTAYFLSPELLDGPANGEAGQVNLYVVGPDQSMPHFVGTLDSSNFAPGPQPPTHPVLDSNFAPASSPESLAVDQTNGDLYIAEGGGSNSVSRYTSTGAPANFTTGPGAGTNKITGLSLGGQGEGQIAVDSAPGSPFEGDLYVTSNGGSVSVFAASGEELGALTGFGEACGVSIDQSNGDVYIGDYSFGGIRRFSPVSDAAPVTNASYGAETSIQTPGVSVCNLEAGPDGHTYAWSYTGGVIKQYKDSEFAASPPSPSGTPVAMGVSAQTDAENGDLYVNEGNQVVQLDPTGKTIAKFGAGQISGSHGIAVDATSKSVYVTTGTGILEFGLRPTPYEPINSPAVLHGVHRSAVHSYEDFQVTPDGHYAAFSSIVPLTEYPNLGHSEIFRYDADTQTLACPSCAPTGAVGASDTKLSGSGLNLIDDGRVFFSTKESYALRDTNEKQDAYEWNEGKVSLISSGIGQYDSGLATASADGKDVFFYTRDTLTPEDESGNVVKIYTAHEDGGFAYSLTPPACKASDECHGPGSVAPSQPDINTHVGAESTPPPYVPPGSKSCKKGQVKRHGKCVKKKAKHKQRKHSKRHSTRVHG